MKPGKLLKICLAALGGFAASCSHTGIAKAGPKPRVEKNGEIPAVMASLRAKEITELKAVRIVSWGELQIEKIQGGTWWVADLECSFLNDLFGPQTTAVKALIRDDKVVKWLYSGSKKEVQ